MLALSLQVRGAESTRGPPLTRVTAVVKPPHAIGTGRLSGFGSRLSSDNTRQHRRSLQTPFRQSSCFRSFKLIGPPPFLNFDTGQADQVSARPSRLFNVLRPKAEAKICPTFLTYGFLAGEEGLEPPTPGFGDHAHSKKQPEKPEISAQKTI